MTAPQQDEVLFVERQFIASVWWVAGLALVCAVLGWSTLVSPPEGTPAWLTLAVWAVAGIAFPALVATCHLRTTVTPEAVVLRYFPLRARTLEASDVSHTEAVTYRPLKEYGGWGIRGWGDDSAYTVKGNRGVRLTLADGSSVLVGSQQPDALAAAAVRLAASR